MGKTTGFMEYARVDEQNKSVKDRLENYEEFTITLKDKELQIQGSRCMDCGIPFCHSACPLGNLIPDFNELIYKGEWESALEILPVAIIFLSSVFFKGEILKTLAYIESEYAVSFILIIS